MISIYTKNAFKLEKISKDLLKKLNKVNINQTKKKKEEVILKEQAEIKVETEETEETEENKEKINIREKYKKRNKKKKIEEESINEEETIKEEAEEIKFPEEKISNEEIYKIYNLILEKMKFEDNSEIFLYPVPNDVPDYYEIIKNPMDMERISSKVLEKSYKRWMEFENDFQQIFSNSKIFNSKGINDSLK
jgi:hypothetical protein